MSIEVRLMQSGESHLANDFFNKIYKTNRSQSDFDWEFVAGPSGPAIYVLAVDKAVTEFIKVVGIQCAIPIKFSDSNGKSVLTAKSEDTLVDPSYRGQKIFERMYELLFVECNKAGIKCIWGFTPAKKAFERIGFEIPFQAHQALMVFRPMKAFAHLAKLNTANKFTDKAKIAGLTFMSWASSLKRPTGGKRDVEMKKISLHSKQKVVIALKQAESYYFLDMSTEYLRWRLDLNPFQNSYESYQFYIQNKLIADVIINIRSTVSYIEQLIFDASLGLATRKQIVGMLVGILKNRAPFLRVLCFDINEELQGQEDLFRSTGFIVLQRGAHFVWKSFAGDEIDPRKIFLSRLFTQGNQ